MRSFFGVEMENYQGDLTDIVRGSGGGGGGGQMDCNSNSASASDVNPCSNWQFPCSDPLNFSTSIHDDDNNNSNRESFFGDPFSNIRDPLLHELNMNPNNMSGSSWYYNPHNSTDIISTSVDESTVGNSFCGGSTGSILAHQKVFEDDLKSPCNIFSRIQISSSQSPKLQPVSPCDSPVMAAAAAAAAAAASPRGIKAPVMVASDMINANSSKSCVVDNSGPVQISSPRNLGIKRRKSQAKKVVCIPAPAAANSRSSGEVVPSDLWAWRKYGQKPIKGSPYPRGYYRCSSSKGCSARKQVERSRTDPNMLVITYTSEHNHPWPTQRNALAGSTRSQPSKTNAASKSSPSSNPQNTTNKTKEEVKESSNDTTSSPTIAAPSSSASVKEEIEDVDKSIDMEDAEFNEEFSQIYKPTLPDSTQCEDFFADLGEIEADPLNLLFSRGFSGDDHDQKENKSLDPFSLFDWSGDSNNNCNNINSTSFGETKRGL